MKTIAHGVLTLSKVGDTICISKGIVLSKEEEKKEDEKGYQKQKLFLKKKK